MKLSQRAIYLRDTHGLTIAEYNRWLEKQNGKCAICLKPAKKNSLAIDHNHKDGRIRGLLCSWCNRGLRFFRDKPIVLKRASAYLLKAGEKK